MIKTNKRITNIKIAKAIGDPYISDIPEWEIDLFMRYFFPEYYYNQFLINRFMVRQ